MVLMSACMPAPPPESDPAMASTRPSDCLMASGLVDHPRHRKRLAGLGDVVDTNGGGAGAGGGQRRRDGTAEARFRVGAVAGDARDEALAAGADQHRKAQ